MRRHLLGRKITVAVEIARPALTPAIPSTPTHCEGYAKVVRPLTTMVWSRSVTMATVVTIGVFCFRRWF